MRDTRTNPQIENERWNRLALHQFVQAGRKGADAETLERLRSRIMNLEKER